MSLKDGEMIERTSDTLGRTAQYKKVGALASIPESARYVGHRDQLSNTWSSSVPVCGDPAKRPR